jgi:DNA-binding transcriptional LysR family regulator
LDTLLSLQVFAEVAERKNFSAVAERMGLSPAMTSKHVQHVERRIGARLLNRNSRNVSLTEAGARYLQTISPLLVECR